MKTRALLAGGLALVFASAALAETNSGLSPQEKADGYVVLFNGKNLDGWQGSTGGYDVKDGVLICRKNGGGRLFTKDQYDDFSFRFEFKLEPGSNNGVGIRAPLKGDPAYVGMEIQVLDNTADKFKNLQPYQYHGSIYGVVPAKRGHLKPVGQWNSEEIMCKGKHVVVKLNGVTIVDADIEKASTPETMDHRKHPGLKRDKGYIGFLGHGAHLEFRNIRIKEL